MSQDQEPVVIEEPLVRAPFTPDQVNSLNAYQFSFTFHEFTCGNDDCAGVDGDRSLYALEDGWHCRACSYTQDWAHAWMADWSWKQALAVAEQYFPRSAE